MNEVWKQLISIQEISDLIENNTDITREDRFRIQSWTYHPLVNEFNDLKPTEYKEVYHLEEQNLFRIISIARMWVFEDLSEVDLTNKLDSIFKLMINLPYPLVKVLNKTHEENPFQMFKDNYRILSFYLLSGGDINRRLRPEFKGKVPTKLFSFRQMTAEEWFVKYCQLVFEISEFIMKKMGVEEAFSYIMSNTAYYLNKSQPFKYYAKDSESTNDAIGRILIEYIHSLGKSDTIITNANIPFYKDLI